VAGLSCGIACLIQCLGVFIQYQHVTDGQTDGNMMMANTALTWHRMVKSLSHLKSLCHLAKCSLLQEVDKKKTKAELACPDSLAKWS